MPDLQLEIRYADGELRTQHHTLWPSGLPRKPVRSVVVREGGREWQIGGHAEFACWHPRGLLPVDPVLIFALSPGRPGQLAGDRWRFYGGRDPEIDVIDETIGSPRLPPAELFVPGSIFVKRPSEARWLTKLRAWLQPREAVVSPHRSSSAVLRSRR